MLVTGKATYLKCQSGESTRNGESRTWYRAAFLDQDMNAVSFYYDNPKLFDGLQATADVELTLSINQGRNGFFVNIIDAQVI